MPQKIPIHLITLIVLILIVFGGLVSFSLKSNKKILERLNFVEFDARPSSPAPTVVDLIPTPISTPISTPTLTPNQVETRFPPRKEDIVFNLTVQDSAKDKTSDLTFQISQATGQDLIKVFKFLIPSGWNLVGGDSIPQGGLVGSGKLVFGDNSQVDVAVINDSNTQGHKNRFKVVFGNLESPSYILDSFIDGDMDTGYVWVFNREPLIKLETPFIFDLTLFGQIEGDGSVVSNPQVPGDYLLGLRAEFLDGTTFSFEKTVSVL